MGRPARGAEVLVSDGGDGQGRSALAAVRALGRAGYRVAVTVVAEAEATSLAASSRWCGRAVRMPPARDARFADAIAAERSRRDYLTVLAASDAVARALDEPAAALTDKSVLAERLAIAGLPSPATQTYQSWEAMTEAPLPYPVVIKPTQGGTSAQLVHSAEELASVPHFPGSLVVQPRVAGSLRAVAGVMWEGALVAAVHQRAHRTWPPDAGPSAAAVTTPPDHELEECVIRLLAEHAGVFQVQLIGDQVIDVNPRIYASLPLAVGAGVNLPALYCDLLQGANPPTTVQRAAVGVEYRWLEGDLRHALWNARNGRVLDAFRSLAPRKGTIHSVESASDPRPSLARAHHVARKLWHRG